MTSDMHLGHAPAAEAVAHEGHGDHHGGRRSAALQQAQASSALKLGAMPPSSSAPTV